MKQYFSHINSDPDEHNPELNPEHKRKRTKIAIVISSLFVTIGTIVLFLSKDYLQSQLRKRLDLVLPKEHTMVQMQMMDPIERERPESNFKLMQQKHVTNSNNNLHHLANYYNSLENLSQKEKEETAGKSNVDRSKTPFMSAEELQLQEVLHNEMTNLFLNDPEKFKLLCEYLTILANSIQQGEEKETQLTKKRKKPIQTISHAILERIEMGILGDAKIEREAFPVKTDSRSSDTPTNKYEIEVIKKAQLGIYFRFRIIGK